MSEVILIKYGEIILKGLNRPLFERKLIKNIKQSLKGLGDIDIKLAQATIYVEANTNNIDEVIARLKKVFGIVYIIRAIKTEKDLNILKDACIKGLAKSLEAAGSFKVETKRADKTFPIKSPEVSRQLGGFILAEFPHLKVDVNNPEMIVNVEIRHQGAYIYKERISGIGGMPVGTGGKAALMLSGGIDSPVAGWMIAKRGVELEGIYFHSHPYTSERAKDKVIELGRILLSYCGSFKLHVVNFTDIQLEIYEKCPHEQLTVIMRRLMMRIAERIAQKNNLQALITGESLAQVASQTIEALAVTNASVSIPVFRPLIGMDKEEIVRIARDIGTFETSILPYEDCCTIFVPKHPNTKPTIKKIEESETNINVEEMVNKAMEEIETIEIVNSGY